jgi:hypothetical protein
MKISIERPCDCGGTYVFATRGDDEFGEARCSSCGSIAHLLDPLSVSVTGERLLSRSKADLEGGEYSLSVVVAVMAVESFLTRLFLKLKGMEYYAVTFKPPTSAQEAEWEKEFPKSGGFPSPAGFVSQKLVGTTFDEFVATNKNASLIFSELPDSNQLRPTLYFQNQLFRRRNRIAHWGYVNTTKTEAQLCHTVALAVVSILREMDTTTDWVGLAQRIAQAARAGVAAERQYLQEILAEQRPSESSDQANQSSQ